ncbi:shTK domain protein [Necator americanus]|uniref:ShTK domain protein n=1 Tax=Necator americanus TaxID=51031 RepID=W2TD35_NECAM|nr:shTK domain protein [Necator americanus]ETN78917.1 shTK domain protein [Necator americanus]
MFLYLLTILLVLNAFTQDAVMAQGCADRIDSKICESIKQKHNCAGPLEMVAQTQCQKTCGFC